MSTDQMTPEGGSATRMVWLFSVEMPSGRDTLGMCAAVVMVGVELLGWGKMTR